MYSPEDPLRPTPVEPPGASADGAESIDVWGYVLSLWNARWLLIAGTMTAALAAFSVSKILPRTYEAIATVFVTSPTFSSQLAPPALSVEAYERLAKSDYVTNEVVQKLREKGMLGPTEQIQRAEVMLYPSREPQKPYLPLLGLLAAGDSPPKAQAIANTWAEVFIQEGKKLTALGKSSSVDFILTQFPGTRDVLHEKEEKLRDIEADQRKAMSSLKDRVAVPLWEDRMRSRQALLMGLEEDAYKTRVDLAEAEQRVAQLQADIERTPQRVTLTKAMSDDAALEAVTRPGASRTLPESRLASETLNPVYIEIAKDLAKAKGEASALKGRDGSIRAQIALARKDADRARAAYLEGQVAIDNLQTAQKVAIAEFERAVDQATSAYQMLGAKVGDAQIAKAEQESDIKLGASAQLPRTSSSPDVRANVMVATLAGLLLSVFAVWIIESVRSHRRTDTLEALRSKAPL